MPSTRRSVTPATPPWGFKDRNPRTFPTFPTWPELFRTARTPRWQPSWVNLTPRTHSPPDLSWLNWTPRPYTTPDFSWLDRVPKRYTFPPYVAPPRKNPNFNHGSWSNNRGSDGEDGSSSTTSILAGSCITVVLVILFLAGIGICAVKRNRSSRQRSRTHRTGSNVHTNISQVHRDDHAFSTSTHLENGADHNVNSYYFGGNDPFLSFAPVHTFIPSADDNLPPAYSEVIKDPPQDLDNSSALPSAPVSKDPDEPPPPSYSAAVYNSPQANTDNSEMNTN